ncbi:hypothetical protein ACT8ZV_20215 [Nocardioides sp. MAHUQ-72]|uniref:hypothetical protein n=1 Tax=unclassified Nocardioides TaxID=2615069 RepID=UPI003616D3ED
MTTPATTVHSHGVDVLHPLVASAFGAAVFATSMAAGEAFDLNADSGSDSGVGTSDLLAYAGFVLAAAVIAVSLGLWARAGSPRRLSRTALGLAVAAAVTVVAFWSSWPLVFGATAVALAMEHRRRLGSLSATSAGAAVVGALALSVAALFCVIG